MVVIIIIRKTCLHLLIDHTTRYVWVFPIKTVLSERLFNLLKEAFNIQVSYNFPMDRNAAVTYFGFKKCIRNKSIKQL